MTTINTLSSVKKLKITVKPKGDYPKDTIFFESVKYINKINESNPHYSIIPVPIEPGSKKVALPIKKNGEVIMDGVLFAAAHSKEKQWSNDKFKDWLRPIKDDAGVRHPAFIEQADYRLGCLVGKGIGILDFDCDVDYKWFKDKFKLDMAKYPVVMGYGHHGCSCNPADHKTYHLYFQKDDFWLSQKKGTNVIYKDYEDSTEVRKIDYLRNSPNNTPHVLLLPSGGPRSKRWVHQPDSITTLPPDITSYFSNNWKISVDNKIQKAVGSNKYLELFKIIPPGHIVQGKFIRMIMELKGQRVEDHAIITASRLLRRTDIKRIGSGNREYTDEEHDRWVSGIIRLYNPQIDRMSIKTITDYSMDTAPQEASAIHRKDLEQCGTEFNIEKIKDIEKYETDPFTRMNLVARYYNKFCIITSCDKISNEPRRVMYNRVGNIKSIRTFKNTREFLQGHDVKIVLNNGKKESSAKWWMENYQRFDECIYKPIGILDGAHNQNPRIYNSFTGYKIKHKEGYENTEYNERGDRIHHHLSKVMSWNEEDPDSMDIYDFLRMWMYKHICEGVRPNVGLVFYSPELGTGKSFMTRCYADFVVGRTLTYQVSRFSSLVNDRFTDGYEDKSLMCVEELPENSYKNKEGWDFFKTFISDDDQESRKIYCGASTTTLHCPVMMNTNHIYAVDGEAASRRLLCVRVNPIYHNNTDYFDKLWKCANVKSWENYFHRYIINKHHEFADTDISPNEHTIPMTKYKRNLLSRSTDSVVIFMGHWLNTMNEGNSDEPDFSDNIGKTWHVEDMFKEYKHFCNVKHHENFIKNTYEFKKKLQDRFEINMTEIQTKLSSKKPAPSLKPRKDVVCMGRDNKGQFIVFEAKLLQRLWELCKKKTRQTEKILEIDEELFNTSKFSLLDYEKTADFISDDELGD